MRHWAHRHSDRSASQTCNSIQVRRSELHSVHSWLCSQVFSARDTGIYSHEHAASLRLEVAAIVYKPFALRTSSGPEAERLHVCTDCRHFGANRTSSHLSTRMAVITSRDSVTVLRQESDRIISRCQRCIHIARSLHIIRHKCRLYHCHEAMRLHRWQHSQLLCPRPLVSSG